MYKVLFRIEKLELIDKLKAKITNLRRYMDEENKPVTIMVVLAGNVVQHFKQIDDFFDDETLDIALCANALRGSGMAELNQKNIRTVRAGIGEIIEKKADGWIEYTIE